MLVAQNRRIDQLVEKIEQQQDKLDKQSLRLQTLQSKVSSSPRKAPLAPERPWPQGSPFILLQQVSHKKLKPHRQRDEETAASRKEAQQLSGEETKQPLVYHLCTWIHKL